MINSDSPSFLPFTFGSLTIPAGCRRIFITTELESSNGDPRIQPTGFPDIGPVLYPDPNPDKDRNNGLICLIESEASMANRLEEVCCSDKYEGTLADGVKGIPYLRVESGKEGNKTFKTASTVDGHRFASDFIAKGKAKFGKDVEMTLAEHIKATLGMSWDGRTMPVARIPEVFELVMNLDTMSLIHGFQISNERISFVGLRLARALTASIVGLNCERVTVPGIKFNVGQVESESGQAIFQKQRITAGRIEARFSIDVGLLGSLRLVSPSKRAVGEDERKKSSEVHIARTRLLIAIALWKVAAFLDLLRIELSLRSECKLRLKGSPWCRTETGAEPVAAAFPYTDIAKAELSGKDGLIGKADLVIDRDPLVLTFQA